MGLAASARAVSRWTVQTATWMCCSLQPSCEQWGAGPPLQLPCSITTICCAGIQPQGLCGSGAARHLPHHSRWQWNGCWLVAADRHVRRKQGHSSGFLFSTAASWALRTFWPFRAGGAMTGTRLWAVRPDITGTVISGRFPFPAVSARTKWKLCTAYCGDPWLTRTQPFDAELPKTQQLLHRNLFFQW